MSDSSSSIKLSTPSNLEKDEESDPTDITEYISGNSKLQSIINHTIQTASKLVISDLDSVDLSFGTSDNVRNNHAQSSSIDTPNNKTNKLRPIQELVDDLKSDSESSIVDVKEDLKMSDDEEDDSIKNINTLEKFFAKDKKNDAENIDNADNELSDVEIMFDDDVPNETESKSATEIKSTEKVPETSKLPENRYSKLSSDEETPTTSNKSNSKPKKTVETIDSDDNYDMTIDWNKNKKKNQNEETWKFNNYDALSDDGSVISIRSNRSIRKRGNKSKLINYKSRNFETLLVRLPERLIELASRNAKKAAKKIREYESRVLDQARNKPSFSHIDFSSFNKIKSTSFFEQSSSSLATKRKFPEIPSCFYDQFLGESDNESFDQPAAKKSKSTSQKFQSDDDEDDAPIRSKSGNKRKRIFSSEDDYDSDSSLDSFPDDSLNYNITDSEDPPTKSVKKTRLRYSDVYDSEEEIQILDETIDNDDFFEILEIFKNKSVNTLKQAKISEIKTDQGQENKENKKDENKKETVNQHESGINPDEIRTLSTKDSDQLSVKSASVIRKRKQTGKRTLPANRKPRKQNAHRRDPIELYRAKQHLSEETQKAGIVEIERQKRIAKINDRFETLNQLSALNNEQTVVLEYGENGQPLVQVDSMLSKYFKDHQKEGVRFLYLNTVESVDFLSQSNGKVGFGSILAHNAGLGKTFQTYSFVHCLLTNQYTQNYFKSVLIATPLNVLNNWYQEYQKWILNSNLSMHFLKFDQTKNYEEKIRILKNWEEVGGVILLSHDIFSNLVLITKDDEPPGFFELCKKLFLDPGPDVVIVDEGHLIKNAKVKLNDSLHRMKTKRRIVLSGTPLQNKLEEYYVMCEYVRPKLLGNYSEYKVNFQLPIEQGQNVDSSEAEVKLMKKRICCLQKVLKNVIHRVGYETLKKDLLPKHEFILMIKLSDVQDKLYREYKNRIENQEIEMMDAGDVKFDRMNTFLKHYSVFNKIYNHPCILKNGQSSLEDWYENTLKSELDLIELSAKMKVFLSILRICERIDDKLVVFSSSPPLLKLIDQVLVIEAKDRSENLQKFKNLEFKTFLQGQDYLHCDGSTSIDERQSSFDKFNDPNNRQLRLFLLTIKACGIGINLIAANRCIIFDASWNPWKDVQAIFRTYRYGQQKEVYIYRFVAHATWEEKIYQKQVQKQALSNRVIDNHQSKRSFNFTNKRIYYEYKPVKNLDHIHKVPIDGLLAEVLQEHGKLIVDYHTHDSLMEEVPDHDLTEEEKLAAWSEFECLKKNTEKQNLTKVNQETGKIMANYLSNLGLQPNLDHSKSQEQSSPIPPNTGIQQNTKATQSKNHSNPSTTKMTNKSVNESTTEVPQSKLLSDYPLLNKLLGNGRNHKEPVDTSTSASNDNQILNAGNSKINQQFVHDGLHINAQQNTSQPYVNSQQQDEIGSNQSNSNNDQTLFNQARLDAVVDQV